MVYPATHESFTIQHNQGEPGATNATAEFINAVTRLLVAIEDKAGLDTDVAATGTGPTAGSIEARLKRVETATGYVRTISSTRPTTGITPGDEWIDSTTHPWTLKIFTGGPVNSGWDFVGANAVQIQGLNVDTVAPTAGQALVWDSATSKIKFASMSLPPGLSNPLANAGDMIIGGTPSGGSVPFVALTVGGESTFLQIVGGLPSWQTPTWISTTLLTTPGDMIYATSSGVPARLASGGGTSAGKVLTIDGSGYPSWVAGYMTNPMAATNDLIIGGALGVPTVLSGGALEANNSKVLTLKPGTTGSPPLLSWEYPHPADTAGDLIYGTGSHLLARVGIGAAGYVLTSVGGVPAWAPIPAAGGGSGIGGITLKDEGALQGIAGVITTLDFVGAGVSASVTGSTATITVGGGGGGGGAGTVESVGLALPAIFNVTGSPVTGTGTLAATLATQVAARFWAGPISGGAAAPAFRQIAPTDLPLFVASGASHAAGIVPDPGATAGAARFLCENGFWVVPSGSGSGGGDGMTDPMALAGDMIIRNSGNVTARLGIGSTGQVLTVTGGVPVWAVIPTFNGTVDGLVGAPGSSNTTQYLRADGAWATPPGAGNMTNPMTTQDDIIIAGAGGNPVRLAKGTDGQVLTIDPSTHHVLWAPSTGSGGAGHAWTSADPQPSPFFTGNITGGAVGAGFSLINNLTTPIVPLVSDGFGACYYNALDNGHTFRFNGLGEFQVGSNFVQVINNANAHFIVFDQFRVAQNSRWVVIGPNGGGDADAPFHLSTSSNAVDTLNQMHLLHNPAGNDGATAAIMFRISTAFGGGYRKGAFYFQRSTNNIANVGIGRFGLALATDPTQNSDVTYADTIFTWSEEGAFGVQTMTPPRGIAVGQGLNIGVQMTTQHPVTGLSVGTEVAGAGGTLSQNGRFYYVVVGLLGSGEETASSAQIVKQLPNSNGNTWRVPLSWTAPSGVTPVNYRVYFYDANAGAVARRTWQYLDTGSSAISYNHDNPVGINVKWSPLGGAEMTAKLSGDAPSFVGDNLGVGAKNFGGGTGGIVSIHNASVVPTSNATAGALLYADTGALKARGSSGTVTTIAPAEPHCPDCGRDFVFEATNPKYGHLIICMWCLTDGMTKGIVKKQVTEDGHSSSRSS